MANDFSQDSSCLALWRFESGALTADSKGSTTLTASANPPTSDTSIYEEGSGSAKFDRTNNQNYIVTDADLPTGFPFKSSGGSNVGTFCFWYNPTSGSSAYNDKLVIAKWLAGVTDKLCFALNHYQDYFSFGWGTGDSTADWSLGQFYYPIEGIGVHITLNIDAPNKKVNIILWDGYTLVEYTHTYASALNITNADLAIGGVSGSYTKSNIDELVVFNRLISYDEAATIRQGIFPSTVSAPAPDSFIGDDNDPPNPNQWEILTGCSGGYNDIQSNQLRLATPGGVRCIPMIQSKGALSTNFNISISFEVITSPPPSSDYWAAALYALIDGIDLFGVMIGHRSTSGGYTYQLWKYISGTWTRIASIATSDISGKLKISKIGTSFNGYYWNGSSWVSLGTATITVNIDCRALIWNESQSGFPSVDVRFGNFALPTGVPIVVTDPVTDISSTSAIGNGNVISDSGETITERGFCWSTSINPTTSNNKVTVTGTIGTLSGTISGLSDDTVYHVRCFATNPAGTGYGEDRSWTTLSATTTEFEEQERRIFSKPIVIITMGSLEIPCSDIIDLDQLVLSRSDDFSVVTSDITITLNNNTGKYSPGKSNFIWAGESWYHKLFKVEFTYQDINEKILLFEGYITKWNLKETKDAAYDSAIDGQFVEVTAEDHCSLLENRIIGKTNDDGSINPFVHGRVFKQAESLDDKTFWTPTDDIDYETGDLTQVDTVTGTGTTVVTDDPYEGTYCAKHQDDAASAYCEQEVAAGGTDEIHLSAFIKFTSMPTNDPTDNGLWFLGIKDTIGQYIAWLTFGSNDDDYGLLTLGVVYHGFEVTNIKIEDHLNRWMKFDIIIRNDTPNLQSIIKLFVDGEETASVNYLAFLPNHFKSATWGIYHFGAPQAGWIMYSDEVKCYDVCYPLGYYLPGFPYQELIGVYIDGIWWPRYNKPKYPVLYLGGKQAFNKLIYKGKSSLPQNYRVNLTYGLIDFLDFENKPTGSILFDIVKDDINHPVDHITAILTEVDMDSRIDTADFDSAKLVNPDDIIGIYIDNQSAADTITNICQSTMMSFIERAGYFGIIPYTGQSRSDYDKEVNRTNCHSFQQATDMSNMQTQVDVIWGWYDQNERLFYRTTNQDMVAVVGTQNAKLDLSFGQDVSSADADMAKSKANLFLNRFSGPLDEFIITGNLSLIRLERGDGVLVNSNLSDSDLIYEIIEKTIDFNDKTVELKLHRYSAESMAAATAGTSSIGPLILISGDATVTSSLLSGIGRTYSPTVIVNGDVFYWPEKISSIAKTQNPTVVYGSISIGPGEATAISTATVEEVICGDITIYPIRTEAIGSTIDPSVTIA